ncbi:MAG TPA: sensor domain-containing diguanylate cyclase [Nodosilinea sp.]|nr:sensor domain-containing diguanylate cyclase [Nodosilinea sp.]
MTPDSLRSVGQDQARLRALRRYRILDTPPDSAFDRITALVAQLLRVPVALATLVECDRIWFKSRFGLAAEQIECTPGLCGTAILYRQPYIIPDTTKDPRTANNPLVVGDFGARFYAAAPLCTHDGYNIGTLCVIDFTPRTITADEIKVLETLAQVIMDQIELWYAARHIEELHQELKQAHETLKVQATHDSLTGLWNRGGTMTLFERTLETARQERRPLTVMAIDIDFFKAVNDTYGHGVGDQVLAEVARRLKAMFRATDTLGRIGGEEFLGLLYPCTADQAAQVAERCRQAVNATPVVVAGLEPAIGVTISLGLLTAIPAGADSVEAMLKVADGALYTSKRGGRDRITALVTPPALASL